MLRDSFSRTGVSGFEGWAAGDRLEYRVLNPTRKSRNYSGSHVSGLPFRRAPLKSRNTPFGYVFGGCVAARRILFVGGLDVEQGLVCASQDDSVFRDLRVGPRARGLSIES